MFAPQFVFNKNVVCPWLDWFGRKYYTFSHPQCMTGSIELCKMICSFIRNLALLICSWLVKFSTARDEGRFRVLKYTRIVKY